MDINLNNKPGLAEFLEDARILTAIQNDFGKHKRAFRMKLEMDINHYAGGDWKQLLDLINDSYQKHINAVKTQDEYDALYQNTYDIACIARVISGDMLAYCGIAEYYIEQIKFTDVVCPCCGKELDTDVIDHLQKDLNLHRSLEWFYSKCCGQRLKDCIALKQLAAEKDFDSQNWQKNLKQAIGARARVEDIEGEPSEVGQVLDDLRAKAAEEEKQAALETVKAWFKGRDENATDRR